MRIGFLALIVFSFIATSAPHVFGQSTVLDNVTFFSTPFGVNDAVYDPTRDVVFATTPSSVGFTLGNRLLEIDPADGAILNATFVGSEPNQLAISSDGSQIYIGIDGAQAVRSYTPGTGTLGAIVNLSDSSGPTIAEDIAVSPGFPNSVVVSRDVVGTSRSGLLEVFNVTGTTLTSTLAQDLFDSPSSNNLLGFVDANTLFTFNSSNSGADGTLFDFDGQTLTLDISQSGVGGGEVEIGRDGRIYFSIGRVVDSSDLTVEGTFDTGLTNNSAVVEPVPELGLTYFAGSPSTRISDVTLSVFDNETFELIDSVPLSGVVTDDPEGKLIAAGENRLALIALGSGPGNFEDPRVLTFISNIPVVVPTAILGDVDQDGVVDFADIPAFIAILQAGTFLAEADVNQDDVVDFADIPAFIEILQAG